MSSKFRVESISEDHAREFWHTSPQATAFTRPDVLACCADKVDWWGAWRSADLVAAWPVCHAADAVAPRNPTFLYYVGPMFSLKIHEFKYHRFQAVRQQALEAMIPRLIEHYGSLRFTMPPGETDIRAFEWWNHDNPEGPAFSFRPRHTARIHDLDRPIEAIHKDFARNRKRDLRLRADDLPKQTHEWQIGEVIDLHNEPMRRQGVDVSKQRIETLRRVVAAADRGNGATLAWRDPDDGHLASFIVLLYGPDDANDILCVASERWRDRGLSAWTTWQGIKHARLEGKKIFDFNGANSPHRAADKHSYNARAEMYFNIEYAPTHQ